MLSLKGGMEKMRKKRGLVVCLLLVLCGAFFPKAPDMPGDVLGAVPDGVESSGEIRGAGGGEVIPAGGISGIGTGTYTVTAEPGAPGDPSSAGLRFLVSEEPETPVYCCNMGRPYAEQGEDTAEGLVKIPNADDGEAARFADNVRGKSPAVLRRQLMRVLFSGFPCDGSGFSRLLAGDEEERMEIFQGITQAALWHVTDGAVPQSDGTFREIGLPALIRMNLEGGAARYLDEEGNVRKDVQALYRKLTDTERLPAPPEGMLVIYRNPGKIGGETAQNFVRLAFREPEKVPLEDSPRASEPELPRASAPELPGTGGDLPLRNDRPGRPSSGRSSHPRPIFRVDVPANAGNTVPVSREVKPAAMGAPVSTAPELSRKEETAENPAARPVRTGEDFPGRFWQGAFAASGLCLAGWCLRQRRRRTK